MQRKTGLKVAVVAGFLGMALALLSACGGGSGVAQKDFDAVKAQLTAKEQEVANLQKQLQARGTGEGAGSAATALREQLAAKEKEIADLKKSQGATQGKTALIWTQVGPLPTPAPAPTPAPPGYVAPTPVPPAAAWVNEVLPFTFYVEQLIGHQTSQIIQGPSCVPNSQFQRGAHVVWRFEVVDTSTGKRLTSLDSPTIKLVLPDGKEVAARYSKRGGAGPWMWSTAWDVPFDYPLGTLDYQIVVKDKAGRTGTFDQDTLALVNKDRGIDSRLQIIP